MSPSNVIRVIVATCFVVFIGLCTAPLAYYAAKVSHSAQAKGQGLESAISASVRTRVSGGAVRRRKPAEKKTRTSPGGIGPSEDFPPDSSTLREKAGHI
jgi:hypothetical protein